MAIRGSGDFYSMTAPDGDCVIWTGAINTNGHGILRRDGKNHRAHRFAWELIFGPLKDTQQLRRTCKNNRCVSPGHMRLVEFEMTESRMRSRHAKGSPGTRPITAAEERFDKFTIPGPTRRPELGPCTYWNGSFMTTGYGSFYMNGKCGPAHRAAWELKVGPIPDGLWALHKCDDHKCVEVSHLFLGTCRDNVLDMHAKGRGYSSKGRSRYALTADQVYEIRDTVGSYKPVAERYGVSVATIHNVRTRRSWVHLPERSANENVPDVSNAQVAC